MLSLQHTLQHTGGHPATDYNVAQAILATTDIVIASRIVNIVAVTTLYYAAVDIVANSATQKVEIVLVITQ